MPASGEKQSRGVVIHCINSEQQGRKYIWKYINIIELSCSFAIHGSLGEDVGDDGASLTSLMNFYCLGP